MKDLDLWRAKLVQLLHDPLHKPLILRSGISHAAAAHELFRAIAGRLAPKKYAHKAADRLATGADRPNLGPGQLCAVDWRASAVLTHPLQPGIRLRAEGPLALGKGAKVAAQELTEGLLEYYCQLLEPLEEEDERAQPRDATWKDTAELRRTHLAVWRAAPEVLGQLGLTASWLPSDSRCPDHSIQDHMKVASAAAFLLPMTTHPDEENGRTPYLLAAKLGGVQTFIEQTRTTRDLWTASMIYAELSWAALLPIVNHYGPDSVVYPDLLENPIADQWLINANIPGVPERVRRAGAATHAAMLPNAFVALVPLGGEGDLPSIQQLMAEVVRSLEDRWLELGRAVRGRLEEKSGAGAWTKVWERQLAAERMPTLAWTAAPWFRRMVHNAGDPKKGLGGFPTALPCLPGRPPDAPRDELPEVLKKREQVLKPWVGPEVWQHYEHAQRVFWQTDCVAAQKTGRDYWPYLSSERGFDYALVHHQAREGLEGTRAGVVPPDLWEPGERCTITGREEALSNRPAGGRADLNEQRSAAREYWRRLNPDGESEERLGGIATLKRYLAESNDPTFTQRWSGATNRQDKPPPFPSTAMLAAQRFLLTVGVLWMRSPAVRTAAAEVLRSLEKAGIKTDTARPEALPRLERLVREGSDDLGRFLRLEPEHLFGETHQTLITRRPEKKEELEQANQAVRALLAEVRTALEREAPRAEGVLRSLGELDQPCAVPGKTFALLRMDGDNLGRLILGDPEIIRTRWRDVLHPEAVQRIEHPPPEAAVLSLAAAGWHGLLDRRRTMGPSMHAAVSRALATFSHRIVGWVVEREFSGRLVYSGGDDLLAVLPGDEGVPAAARLQQLFSAPFVLDALPDEPPWAWRLGNGGSSNREHEIDFNGQRERQRFQIPILRHSKAGDEPAPVSGTTLSDAEWEPHASTLRERSTFRIEPEHQQLFMQLGRAHSLSGGVVIAHYKAPLRDVIREAKTILEQEAKARPGKGSLAISHRTRGGSKVVFMAPWRMGVISDDSDLVGAGRAGNEAEAPMSDAPPDLQAALGLVVEAIRANELASRAPYKLREALARASVTVRRTNDHLDLLELRHALVCSAVGVDKESALARAVCHIVDAGFEAAERRESASSAEWDSRRWAHEAVSGLLLARSLATGNVEE